jgi:hypothetical protein
VLDDPRQVPYLVLWQDRYSEAMNAEWWEDLGCYLPNCQRPRRALYAWEVDRRYQLRLCG